MELVNRYGGDFLGRRVVAAESGWKKPLKWNREAEKQQIEASDHNHRFCLDTEVDLVEPQRPRVFCASLADIFEDYGGQMSHSSGVPMWRMHEPNGHQHQWGAGHVLDDPSSGVPLTMDSVRRRLFDLIDATPNLDWLLLTKRPENILKMWPRKHDAHPSRQHMQGDQAYRPNVWLGTTVENQEQADKRIPELLKCRDLSPVLFLSCEPLLGPVDLRSALWLEDQYFKLRMSVQTSINWVIVGGESGKGARPMNPDWAEDLRNQCGAARVPFFFKQWGEWQPERRARHSDLSCDARKQLIVRKDGQLTTGFLEYGVDAFVMNRVGKRNAGRLLLGKEWSQFPGSEASE
jgi:protein gp37